MTICSRTNDILQLELVKNPVLVYATRWMLKERTIVFFNVLTMTVLFSG